MNPLSVAGEVRSRSHLHPPTQRWVRAADRPPNLTCSEQFGKPKGCNMPGLGWFFTACHYAACVAKAAERGTHAWSEQMAGGSCRRTKMPFPAAPQLAAISPANDRVGALGEWASVMVTGLRVSLGTAKT